MTADRERRMIDAIHAATTSATTGMQAGKMLAEGGWAVLPVPIAHDPEKCAACLPVFCKRGSACHGKHDQGPRAMTYAKASHDRWQWRPSALAVANSHHVGDVNVAVSPWRCLVPLVGVDLDGPAAVAAFEVEHPDGSPAYFRVESSGKGGGRHVYIAGQQQPIGGRNPWGGEYRADRGHLMLPPSLVDGRRDYYRPTGDRFLRGIELSVRSVSSSGKVSRAGGAGASALSDPHTEALIDRLSIWPAQQGKVEAFREHVEVLAEAPVGERHPAMKTAVCSAVARARLHQFPLRGALDLIVDAFPDPEHGRDIRAEVTAVASWALAQELAS